MRTYLAPYLLLCVSQILACGSAPTNSATSSATGAQTASNTAAAATHAVAIANFAFSPATLTIAKGDSLAFTNQDSAAHDMAIKAGENDTADTGSIAQGVTKTMVFAKAGTYTLYCTIHPSMTFALVVQ